jgi:hypothetical protein
MDKRAACGMYLLVVLLLLRQTMNAQPAGALRYLLIGSPVTTCAVVTIRTKAKPSCSRGESAGRDLQ